ncbi:uncharacterized protein LOC106667986 [Cimex lectularius]|uniref:Uncharacterized protein n=1 Tax=Cimex lectularius TaxID=79782 RepID=A0A8I6RUV6_CIMLE|nr:uncharacterized protein LOC106667986 [Cimex lectularius]
MRKAILILLFAIATCVVAFPQLPLEENALGSAVDVTGELQQLPTDSEDLLRIARTVGQDPTCNSSQMDERRKKLLGLLPGLLTRLLGSPGNAQNLGLVRLLLLLLLG